MAASERSTGPSCPLYLAAHLSNLKLAKPRAVGVALREALHNVVRHRDPGVPLGHIKDGGGDPEPTAWNRLRAGIVWDEPVSCHGRVHILHYDGGRVTWTWKKGNAGQWKILRTESALPNFGEMLWNRRGP